MSSNIHQRLNAIQAKLPPVVDADKKLLDELWGKLSLQQLEYLAYKNTTPLPLELIDDNLRNLLRVIVPDEPLPELLRDLTKEGK